MNPISFPKLITPITATTPTHLTITPVTTTALITSLSRRCHSPITDPPLPSPLVNIPTDGPTTVEMVNATKDNFDEDDLFKFQELLLDAEKPLYEGLVDTYDASTKDNFNLCAVVLWTINDYLHLVHYMAARTMDSKVVKQNKAFNGQQEFLLAPNLMTGEQIYNEVQHIESKWGKGKQTNNKAENQEDTRGRGGKVQKKKRNTTEEEGSSSQVNRQNDAYWKKFNIWYQKLRYLRHHSVPHCIDFIHVEKNVAESLVGTLLNVPGKTKDRVNARLDLAKLGVKPELFAMQEDKTTLPPAGYTLTNAEKDIFCETLYNIKSLFNEYHKSMETIGIPPDKHETDENAEGKPLSTDKLSEVSVELFQKVEIELAISKESVSKTVRWISYRSRATIVKYDAYNINGYTFRMKCHYGKVYQNSRVSVEAIDLHISKEVATTRQAFYYGVLQEIRVLDYRFRQISLLKCDWVNHRAGGVKRDTTLGYPLVDLNNLGHKTPSKNYKDTNDEVDEEFSTVIHQHNDNILPRVD
nr:hypothetical protein [Tanacetum cinerariifolium]